jgi:hypothetical protein
MTLFANLIASPSTEVDEDDHPPGYGTVGWVLVEILGCGGSKVYRYDIDEFQVDGEASTFWINEGVGGNYWIDAYAPDHLKPGWYAFENVVGTYHLGAGWITGDRYDEDDEEWEYSLCRPATLNEIATLCVVNSSAKSEKEL